MAGVNIEAGNDAVNRIKRHAKRTFTPNVLSAIGGFGALYDLKSLLAPYEHPVLVQSIDGVGTKTMIARMMGKFDTIGMDVVSATANDIVVLGATPLTLLDYIANEKLDPIIIEQIIQGMAEACLANGISLIGGETAEMPGTYLPGEYDLVGVITGVVEKNKVITGQTITPGDVVLGLASSGLHTNGYSLARKLFFEVAGLKVDSWVSELNGTVGQILLEPHLNYTRPVLQCLNQNLNIKGMAHITGGGFLENIPRVLPDGCGIEIAQDSWPVLPVFQMMQHLGKMSLNDLYQTFNMGIGLIMIVSENMVSPIQNQLMSFSESKAYEIGRVVQSNKHEVRII
jgi:phosphoribosylformylglycinamidine cyclo-ligase